MIIESILGIAGGLLPKVFGFFEERDREKRQFSHELQLLDRQAKSKKEEAEARVEEAAYGALAAGVKAARATSKNSVWVHNSITMFRPVLTSALVAVSSYIVVTSGIDIANLEQVTAMSEHPIMKITTLTVCFWFSARSNEKK